MLTTTLHDTATPALARLSSLVTSRGALGAGGRAMRASIVQNLNRLGTNQRFSGASTGFYQRAAQSIPEPLAANGSVTVSVTQSGLRQRWLGGPIAPVSAKYLTIPAQEAAYGKRAADFPDLTLAFMGRSATGLPIFALIEGTPSLTQKKNVMFWLVRSVEQEGNSNVMPDEDELKSAFAGGVRDYLHGSFSGGGNVEAT